MPERDIDRLRASYERLGETGEWPQEGLLSPDFELHQDPFLDGAKVFQGPEAASEILGRQGQAFREMSFEAERLIQAPAGEVVVLLRIRARGRASGMAVDRVQAHVWTFADGAAVTMRIYERPAEALKAVGLEQ